MMAKKKKGRGQGRGVNISGGQIKAGRDVTIAGRDIRISIDTTGLARRFAEIYKKIEARPPDPNVDKSELKDTVKKIEEEVKKGDEANSAKIERWLQFLAGMSDDIFQVTAATLASPAAGLAKAVQLIAQKAKEDKA